MKKILVLGLLLVQGLFAQVPEGIKYATIPIYISTKTITSVATDSAGYWLVLTDGLGAPVDTGQYVWGDYIQPGTQVVSITGTGLNDSVRVSKPILDNVTETVAFGVRVNTSYTTGDVLGWSFRIGPVGTIWSAAIVDTCDTFRVTQASFDMLLFDSRPDFEQDSTTSNLSDANAVKLCGQIQFVNGTGYDLGGTRFWQSPVNLTGHDLNPYVLFPRDSKRDIWGRLVVRQTTAMGVVPNMNCLFLKIAYTE